MTDDEALKKNILLIADDHRQKCEGICEVSLVMLFLVAERAGLRFTDDERRLFT